MQQPQPAHASQPAIVAAATDERQGKLDQPILTASAPTNPGTVDAAITASAGPPAPVPTDVAPATTNAQPPTPAPIARQIGDVAVTLLRSVGGGDRQLTVRLDPPQLGRVQVAIAQARGGAAAVTLTVERPETLLLALRDEPALHRALDRAGVPTEARTVTVQLAPQRAEPSADRSPLHPSQPGSNLLEQAPRDHGHGQARQTPLGQPTPTARQAADADDPADPILASTQSSWQRAGIDITA